MAEFLLEAETNPILLQNAQGTGSTKVHYASPFPIFLWKRVNGGPVNAPGWFRETLWDDLNPDDPGFISQAEESLRNGTRTSNSLRAGGFVEYGMLLEAQTDPNTPGFKQSMFVAYLIIDYLIGSSVLVDPLADNKLVPGGTFVQKVVHTTGKTRFRMQVTLEEPDDSDPTHPLVVPNPVAEVTSTSKLVHDVDAAPLVPGTRYFAVTLLIGESGAWQSTSEPFITKQRTVTIQFTDFEVVNDGDEDPWGKGDDAEVTLRVFKGQDQVGGDLKWGPGGISDVGGARTVFVNFPDVVVGPEALNGKDTPIGIGLYALERDYFMWALASTDEAEYQETFPKGLPLHTKLLRFPFGRGIERVPPPGANFDIWASPIGGDGELRIKANVRFGVEYA